MSISELKGEPSRCAHGAGQLRSFPIGAGVGETMLRRQNPPQAHITRAEHIERYLHPAIIGSIYAGLGIFYALLVSAIFGVLLHGAVLKNSPATMGVFAFIVVVPAMLAIGGFFVRPNDPLSRSFLRVAQTWRRPLDLHAEDCTFSEGLMNGESVRVKALFYYPVEGRSPEVIERVHSYVKSALMRNCSLRSSAPTQEEVADAINGALEIVAHECGIPILYCEIQSVSQVNSNLELCEGRLLEASA